MRAKIATIDPGVVGTGVATWNDLAADERPFFVEVISPPKTLYWVERCRLIKDRLTVLFKLQNVRHVYCELPEYFGGSAVGNAAAHGGSVVKLTFGAAMVAAAAFDVGARFETVDVTKWKGQLPKDVVTKRVRKEVGGVDGFGDKIKTHGWDAVGIGLYLGGRF